MNNIDHMNNINTIDIVNNTNNINNINNINSMNNIDIINNITPAPITLPTHRGVRSISWKFRSMSLRIFPKTVSEDNLKFWMPISETTKCPHVLELVLTTIELRSTYVARCPGSFRFRRCVCRSCC